MAGLGNAATTAIITKGLSCSGGGSPAPTACERGIITSFFSLVCTGVVPPVPPIPPEQVGDSGGGPYPGPAWNKFDSAADIFKPVEGELPYYVPLDKEADYFRRYQTITLRIKLGDNEIEKVYRVPEDRAKIVVKAIDVVNATRERISVTVTGIKNLITKAIVTIKNLRRIG